MADLITLLEIQMKLEQLQRYGVTPEQRVGIQRSIAEIKRLRNNTIRQRLSTQDLPPMIDTF